MSYNCNYCASVWREGWGWVAEGPGEGLGFPEPSPALLPMAEVLSTLSAWSPGADLLGHIGVNFQLDQTPHLHPFPTGLWRAGGGGQEMCEVCRLL